MSDSSEKEVSQDESRASDEEIEEEQSDDEQNSDDNEVSDLDADLTESDEDSAAEASIDEENDVKAAQVVGIDVKTKIISKYQERKGKQLYVRFPAKLPLDEKEFQQQVQALSPLIIKSHKPRQRHARFCLVDFDSESDRDAALKAIKAAAKSKKPGFQGVMAEKPRTDNEEFVNELAEKKVKSLENKKAKLRLKKAAKQANKATTFTSSIVILNLPKAATESDVRALYPTAVDIQLKPSKGKFIGNSVASITLPTTMDAKLAVKKRASLNGVQLMVKFNVGKPKKKNKKLEHKKVKKSKQQNSNEKQPTNKGKAEDSSSVSATLKSKSTALKKPKFSKKQKPNAKAKHVQKAK